MGERINQAVAELPGDAEMLFLEACYEDCDAVPYIYIYIYIYSYIYIYICIYIYTGMRYLSHPGGNTGANLKSISHRCYLFETEFAWELSEQIYSFAPGMPPGQWRF